MGVEYLTTFAKNQANIHQEIDILDEIQKFREQTKKDAIIIFDVMGFIHKFGHSHTELILGGRRHMYLLTFEKFILELIHAGASLAFFCDGQLKSDRINIWCERREHEFKVTNEVLAARSKSVKLPKKRFGCKAIVSSLLKLIEDKRYGDIVIATHMDCDAAIAKYANENDALAVIASDCDFLIFDGKFQWWDVISLQMHRMVAKSYNRNKFIEILNLTYDQMKYLATIGGNDYTRNLIRKRYDFHAIANFCRSLCSDYDETICHDIIKFMKIEANQNNIDCVNTSIKSYDIKFDESFESSNRMDKYCASNVLLYAFWTNEIFQYEANFLHAKESEHITNNNLFTIMDTLLMVFRKLGGILLKSSSNKNPVLKIVTKYSSVENYTLKEHVPVYPEGFVDIEELIFETDDYDENKWNLLLWSLNFNPRIQYELRDIPKPYILTVLALLFLYQANEISTLMADALLLSQYNILKSKSNLDGIVITESSLTTESIRVGQLFNRTITLLWDCLMVCGLKRFIQPDCYDGPYFHYLLTYLKQLNHIKYDICIEPIRKYRLYDTLVHKDGNMLISN